MSEQNNDHINTDRQQLDALGKHFEAVRDGKVKETKPAAPQMSEAMRKGLRELAARNAQI